MDISVIHNLAREMAWVSSTDFPDSRLLLFTNLVKDSLWSYIVTGTNEDLNWDIWEVDSGSLVVGQSEYVLPEATFDAEGNLKVAWLSICYDWEEYPDGSKKYVKAKEVKVNDLREHWNYYVNNQSKLQPIYYIADQSVFIAPTLDQVSTSAIEVRGIKTLIDYATTTVEADIRIPRYLHEVWAMGIVPYIWRAKQRINEAQEAENRYKNERNTQITNLRNRHTNWFMMYPDDTSTDTLFPKGF